MQIFWCSPMAIILTLGQASRGSPRAPGLGGCVSRSRVPAQAEEVTYFSYTVPEYVISEWLSRRTQIMMIDLLGAVIAVEQMSEKMAGKRITLFIDSEAAEAALIKGYSARFDINDLAGYMWDLVAKRDIGLYVARVPTDGNPSDGPSRADFSELERRGARWVTSQPSALLLSANEWLKDLDRRVSRVAERNRMNQSYQWLHEHVPREPPPRSLDNGRAPA